MRSIRNLVKKLNEFYTGFAKKRSNKRICLQADQEFQQNDIKKLNRHIFICFCQKLAV